MGPFLVVAALIAVVVVLVARDAAARRNRKQLREHREEQDETPPPKPRRRRPEPPKRARARTAKPAGDDFVEKLARFAADPTAENYRAVFDLVVAHPAYEPYGSEIQELETLYAAGDHEAVGEQVREMMPSWLLTPSVHKIACLAAKHRGDKETAMMEMQIAIACIDGILATGDGTRESPHLVTRVRDEYDVLQHLEKELKSQALVKEDGRALDHLTCTDNSEIWFDVTAPHAHLSKRMAAALD